MDSLVGQRLGNKYQIEQLLGRGGMATVYRAHDTVLNRSVAIKVLEPSLAIDPNAVERFRREAVTAANLEHPSIVRVFDVQQAGNVHYIAMRYVNGRTLREIMRDNGPLPMDAVTKIVKPVASALHYAHQHGVIHRDVKPGNILVEPDGTVLLTDFGIARAMDTSQSALTMTGQVMGTADYLAPEQISGKPATPRSDVYSLGVVLYEMLTGVTPFAGETTASILYRQVHENPRPLRAINPRLPAELQPVIDRALAKNPALRYADPLDMARDLDEASRWLPPGSPWTNRGPNATIPHEMDGRRASGPLSGPQGPEAGGRQAGGADDRNGPLTVLSPPVRRERATLALVLAFVLLLAGAMVIAMAAGVIPTPGKAAAARFEPPGAATYSGQLRKGNGADLHIPRAVTAPSIDGDLADWTSASPRDFNAPYVTLNRPDWGGPDDLSASFNFAWDNDNFYVGAVITDDIHVQLADTRGYNLFKGDDVEIWFDTELDGDFAVRQANGDDFQLGLSPGNFKDLAPEAVFWNPDRSDERNKSVRVAARQRETGNGYTLEAAVPWTAFGDFAPRPGWAIGFAASAGDNDRLSTPGQELMISTCPTLQYKQPFTFGNLFF